MTDSEDNAAVFDSAEAFERVDNDKELFFELVDMFFDDYDEVVRGLQKAIEAGEAKHLEERAHSVKSALGNLGAMKAYHDAMFLERAGREDSLDGASERFEQLKESVLAFRQELKHHR